MERQQKSSETLKKAACYRCNAGIAYHELAFTLFFVGNLLDFKRAYTALFE
jgi:hypothetical protein